MSQQVIDIARGWIGTPYRHQASLKHIGADCLGLIRGIWRELYDEEPERAPPYAADWAELRDDDPLFEAATRNLTRVSRAIEPGDVLLFRYKAGVPCKHAAIAVHETQMIHAYDGAAVAETSLTPWWRRRIAAKFIFPTLT